MLTIVAALFAHFQKGDRCIFLTCYRAGYKKTRLSLFLLRLRKPGSSDITFFRLSGFPSRGRYRPSPSRHACVSGRSRATIAFGCRIRSWPASQQSASSLATSGVVDELAVPKNLQSIARREAEFDPSRSQRHSRCGPVQSECGTEGRVSQRQYPWDWNMGQTASRRVFATCTKPASSPAFRSRYCSSTNSRDSIRSHAARGH